MSSKRARNRSGHLSKSTLNGLTLVVILASIICSVIIIIFIYQHLCRRKRRRKRDGDGYTAVGVSDPYGDDDGGWTSYDSNALDWDPEEARVKRRLNVVEKRKKKLTKQVELLDQQLTARREALDRVSDHSSQLTSRLNTARDQPTGIGSNIGNIPADSPALAAIDAKGKEMFGDKWMKGENGGPPMRSILGLAPEDLEQIKRGLETARAEATSSSSSRRSSGRDQRGNGTAANINSQMGDNDYEDHSQLLARTSILADRLRAATSQNTPRRR